MKVNETKFAGLKILHPSVYEDDRGYFSESFNQQVFDEQVAKNITFVQDNHSQSKRGVLRGLHYQISPKAQAKLVRVVLGEVYCVVVDLRADAATYCDWLGIVLSADNKRQLWVPEGFAHGFYVMSEVADYLYKTTNYYAPEYERSVAWNDSSLNIDWPISSAPLLSVKDQLAPTLKQAGLL